jgi:hypothetical protein
MAGFGRSNSLSISTGGGLLYVLTPRTLAHCSCSMARALD